MVGMSGTHVGERLRAIRRIVVSTGVTFLAFQAILEGFPMLRLDNPLVDAGVAHGVEQHSGRLAVGQRRR